MEEQDDAPGGRPKRVKASGLKWQRRKKGPDVPYWVADEALVKKGFHPRTANLQAFASDAEALRAQCAALDTKMRLWAAGISADRRQFDGTIRSLLDTYETHRRSTFHSRRPGTRVTYSKYIRRVRQHVGNRMIDEVTGADLLDWRDVWIEPDREGEKPKLAAALTARAVLLAAAKVGVSLRLKGSGEFYAMIKATEFEKPASRTQVLTVDEIIAARKAAHAAGRPRRALAYAITFETGLRLSDVVGLWLPFDAEGVSEVIHGNLKWVGLRFEDITNSRLAYTPSKTRGKTGKTIAVDLSLCPMVLEELEHVPEAQRDGPVILNEQTGQPYVERDFRERGWRRDFKAAGIGKGIWARDMRASASTEARAAGASTDDTAQFLGKTDRRSVAQVYDRASFEAHQRVAKARLSSRNSSET